MPGPQDVLHHARSQIGFVEGPRNDNPYAAEVGHANHQPWCATFVAAMFKRAGVALPNQSPYTPTMFNGLKGQGRQIPGPEVGALAFLYFSSLGRIAHVGIVEEVRADGRFVTIEGNTDVAGGRTGGRVMRKVRSRSGWSFGMPAYDNKPAPAPIPSPPKPSAPVVPIKFPAFPLPSGHYFGPWNGPNESVSGFTVRRGRIVADPGHPQLRLFQQHMKNRGWHRIVVDGLYGNNTRDIVKAFQREKGLTVDGKVGPATWKAAWTAPL